MASPFDVLPTPYARLDDPVFRVRGLSRNRESHFPIYADFWVSTLNLDDRLGELSLRLHRRRSWTNSQIDIEGARCGNERRFMYPSPFDGADDALRRDQSRPVPLRVDGKPFFQFLDHRRGIDNRVAVRRSVTGANVAEIALHHHLEPTKSDLFPRHRPTGLGDDREIAA